MDLINQVKIITFRASSLLRGWWERSTRNLISKGLWRSQLDFPPFPTNPSSLILRIYNQRAELDIFNLFYE
jgi:hypothetical protein